MWVLAIGAGWVLAIIFGGETREGVSVPGSESDAAFTIASESPLGHMVAPQATLLFSVDEGEITAPDRAAAITRALVELSAEGYIGDPDQPFVNGQVSDDQRHAYAEVRYALNHEPRQADLEQLETTSRQLEPVDVDVAVGGTLPAIVADPAPAFVEYLGVLIALLVLWRALGSMAQAAWPIVTAMAGVGLALGIASLVTRWIVIPEPAFQLAGLIGMAVGIDYGLLVICQWRRSGADPTRTVALACATVIASISGPAVLGIPYFTAIMLMTILSAVCVTFASLTLLPALLAMSESRSHRHDPMTRPAPWVVQTSSRHGAFLRRVVKRPWVYAFLGLLSSALLIAPVAWLSIGHVDGASVSADENRRVSYSRIEESFGSGYNAPFTVALDLGGVDPWLRADLIDGVVDSVDSVQGIAGTLEPIWGFEGEEAVFRALPEDRAGTIGARESLVRLRSVVSESVSESKAVAAVGGDTATRIDVASRVQHRLPWMVLLVIAAAFVLLSAFWRTPLLAVKAVVINSFSVLIAYGVLVVVFQWGWGSSALGLGSDMPIDPIVPVFLFAILFGLSMDYEVFLISAVRAAFDRGLTTNDAIVSGLASRRRLVITAAVVMAAVFSGFIVGIDPVTKMFGVGLTTAVLADVTISRAWLVPSGLVLLGEANQWVPQFLEPRRRTRGRRSPASSQR